MINVFSTVPVDQDSMNGAEHESDCVHVHGSINRVKSVYL